MDAARVTQRRSLRTPNDVSALCVELLRAVREQEFNARHRSGPAASIDRAWRAWRADLDRYGPLHLVAGAQGLREGDDGPPIGRGRLDDLAHRFQERTLASVRFEPGLDAPTYAAFVSLLVAEPREVASHGGAAGFLPERGVGIRLIGPGDALEPDDDKPDTPGAEDGSLDTQGIDDDRPDAPDEEEDRPDAPDEEEDRPDAPDDEEDRHLLPEPEDDDVPQIDPNEATAPVLDATGESTVRLRLATGENTVRMPPRSFVSREEPTSVAEAPADATPTLEAPPPGSALAALVAGDATSPYGTLVARAVEEATGWSDARDTDACHRTVLELGAQAREQSGRIRPERSAARGALRELCTGRVLTDLIGRATVADRAASLEASRVLIQLGEQVAPELISAIDVEAEPSRREELVGIAIALGRPTTPTLHRAMEGNSPNRARIAARIVGEIQDERAVPTLSKLLGHKRAEVRGESARALARIGNVAALTSLKSGLASQHEDVSSLCAYCLGVTGSSDAAEALTETLRDARRARRTQLASAVIRSLGRLGREESIPALKRVIDKRSFFRRHELRELKLQSIGALANVPGDRARQVLEAVAGGSDMGLAVAARRALKEKAEASA
ncbi:MAG: HEAT repeat domain-containing protein [Deltaproteobacteria bacterium]|nr:HEAT repeat domain-containing protein [Deltaproteobacteria bacterium]MBW2444331.1 HEAT repeat domain-containing protein [Deltaproteobacteria bacterium]